MANMALNIEKKAVINFPVSRPCQATCLPPYQTVKMQGDSQRLLMTDARGR